MNTPNPAPGSITILEASFSLTGILDPNSIRPTDDSRKWSFQPDPFTALGANGAQLCTFARMIATAYRGQIPSGLHVVMDFDYTTYGWRMPYSAYWELQMKTAQGVLLETFSFNIPGAHKPCPPRTVHFNHTYAASSDYFGVLDIVKINYIPAGPMGPC